MWVQLLSVQHLDIDGSQRTYRPGDWVNIGKMAGLRLLERGQARSVTPVKMAFDPGCGVVHRGDDPGISGVPCTASEPALLYEKNLIVKTPITISLSLLSAGFGLLDRWEVAIQMTEGYPLANSVGTDEDRAATEAVIRDLRIPLPDTRAIFVKSCPASQELIALWNTERQKGDERLAWLRAIYTVKPVWLALPPVWAR